MLTKMRTIEINGNNFSNLSEFYDEVESKMTSGLNWKIGRNLNAFDDVLSGGFGVHDVDEKYQLNWKNVEKSKSELGWTQTIEFIENKLKTCHPTNIEFVKKDLEDAKNGTGETLWELIIGIIKEHNQIELKLN
jgi:RNAse (barnase) inhibitor barstar|tara:strand:- start:35 stop:436 length:402 start_codon:yes stop_codon:yes gene_type:complete